MRYLLDVNILVAWGWADHVDHHRTVTWIIKGREEGAELLTSAIPELGFVRVSCQRTGGRITLKRAGETLSGMLSSLGKAHAFLADDQPADRFAEWCRHASRTTDAHLLQLAEAHDAQLATIDRGIPGAFLVPE